MLRLDPETGEHWIADSLEDLKDWEILSYGDWKQGVVRAVARRQDPAVGWECITVYVKHPSITPEPGHMQINRNYPTPDTERENCGPRERALAVFKYLFDMEPEQASKHERFQLVVAGFEQQARVAMRHHTRAAAKATGGYWRRLWAAIRGRQPFIKNMLELLPPLEEEQTGTRVVPGGGKVLRFDKN